MSSIITTPSELEFPCFLMNFPFTVRVSEPNNPYMNGSKDYNYDLAFEQFMKVYNYVASKALIYILPSEKDFQDLPYVANIGCYLPHFKKKNIIILANFKSPPRKGEDVIGRKFFTSMGYKVYQPQNTFEGEADLKWVRDNIYIGGWGIRTDRKTYEWMKDHLDMNIVSVKMEDEKLYHYDCSYFQLSPEKALVATSVLSKKDIKDIELVVEIVEVPKKYIYNGWTNCIILGNKVLHAPATGINDNKEFSEVIEKQGFEPIIFDLSEYEKSGADLSCLFLHLNYNNRKNYLFKSNPLWWGNRIKKLYKSKQLSISALFKNRELVHNGIPIVIEIEKGQYREHKNGKTKLLFDYGYFKNTKAVDDEDVDCYIGPDTDAKYVYVVKQLKPDKSYDEPKCMLNFGSETEAKVGYLAHYPHSFYGGITTYPIDKFKDMLKESNNDPTIIKSRLLLRFGSGILR